MTQNFIFISPNFPKTYYQFPLAWKQLGGRSFAICDANYDTLTQAQKDAFDDYYQVNSLENYDEVYRAVAWFAHKYGKIDWLEANNEYWLLQDAKLRLDFNIPNGDQESTVIDYKYKSKMKAYYHKANIPTARYHLVTNLTDAKYFITEVHYPVIAKPDGGVGANATYKITNEIELNNFFDTKPNTQYIMEEYVPGYIISFDGIVDSNNQIIYRTCHTFPDPVMEIVNRKEDCIFWNEIQIPEKLNTLGERLIHAYNIKSRFFHTEYFCLTQDKPGLGKKGDYIGLEVNMRPPGGYMLDMVNYAQDTNIFMVYARMCMHKQAVINEHPIYYCVHVGKRDIYSYQYTDAQIQQKYNKHIVMHERMPQVLEAAMGNEFYVARFTNKEEMISFINDVTKKEENHDHQLPKDL